ncbi:AAA-like domain-containing protein [Desulfonema magnum]|uniref:AAA ATPase domain-containing protein n=1 Tax=Desulfonema magnum TaxID=45655 RepID=A0A975GRG1_9BACT|nr:AAA-like domain-containing protein [Desulfonema magnum]QTA90870.1 AAA ATPase domain-containing protein [Desulfonema magnum]
MRKFSSYGPVDKDLHFHVSRQEIIQNSLARLIGDNPNKGGHYITVWAPRQCGKTWIMNEVFHKLRKDKRFHVLSLDLEYLKMQEDTNRIFKSVANQIAERLKLKNISADTPDDFHKLFMKGVIDQPLILMIDEFDALAEDAISALAGVFRYIYNMRQKDPKPSSEKEYLLHGVALIGVRSVLGIENRRGSPFNVQRSLHIPRLTFEEVESMFGWYERESGQKVEPEVTDRVFYETRGQPGLVSWFGELLTEGFDEYEPDQSRPVTMDDFDYVYAAASQILPNNNILNIISKAKQEPYRQFVIELFKTDEKVPFKFDEPVVNFLYMNGVIDREGTGGKFSVRFPCPFVQKRLFNYFSYQLFPHMGIIYEPFEDTDDIVTEKTLNVRNLMKRYERHLQNNRDWMLRDAPRRSDLRIYEAVFHFNLYEYLVRFLGSYDTKIWPEFPTGNGKVDILIEHGGKLYALELKSYKDKPAYSRALEQAAQYGKELSLKVIYLVVFVEHIDDKYRNHYEKDYQDENTGVTVVPVFVATGN